LSHSAHAVAQSSGRATTRYPTIDNHNNNGDEQAQHVSQSTHFADNFAGKMRYLAILS
jgi:hypothetical protein